MTYVRVIQISRASSMMSRIDAEALAERSAKMNRLREVTGLLLQVGTSFVQVLEGEEVILDIVLARLAEEDWHTDMRVISRHTAATRMFATWSMGCFDIDDPSHCSRLDYIEMRGKIEEMFTEENPTAEYLLNMIRSVPSMMSRANAGPRKHNEPQLRRAA